MMRNIRIRGDLSELVLGLPSGPFLGKVEIDDYEPEDNAEFHSHAGPDNAYEIWTQPIKCNNKDYTAVFSFRREDVADLDEPSDYPWENKSMLCLWVEDNHITNYAENMVIGKTLGDVKTLNADWTDVWPLIYEWQCISIVDSDGHAWLGDYDTTQEIGLHDQELSDYMIYKK